ncbi:type I restriction endonuclease subunit R [Lyngbya sp. CCAP 1446/10]|uniref:type I restriction endonuclease subunit R n=1 Tax=Lyngbya sp. CCAP 1446/10 TaxID=439293 RepID=UPI002238A700|nr:type I restriction endonuclease subunit R [Lyngbya sp. CCAP 1446/10]MCW6053869.1 type I restriction endonuclease subunit R [Lyngbya sp. CCAP 1446/10]
MTQTTAITEIIATLADVESRFRITRTESEGFFPEWYADLPEITEADKSALNLIRRRYLYHLNDGNLTEGTVTLIMGSPLLERAGFYDSPFKMTAEKSVRIVLEEEDEEVETLKGRIDVLVMQNQFWVTLLESKRTTISVMSALPQTLAYMTANPRKDRPSFAAMTNGSEIVFVKLDFQNPPQYDLSRIFSPLPLMNELYTVLQVLKKIGQLITES